MTNTAHALVVVLTVCCVTFILRLVRRRALRAKYAVLWLSIGIALIVLAASPSLLDRVSGWVGIYYAPATFFLGAIALLFLIVIHFSWELSRLEDRSRRLAEEVALLRLEMAERPAAPAPPVDVRDGRERDDAGPAALTLRNDG